MGRHICSNSKVGTSSLAVTIALLAGCASDPVKKGNDAFATGDCATAFHSWLPKAKAGDSVAQNNMGVLWQRGCPAVKVPQNPLQAYNWYTQSASRGFPLAYQNLGFLYLSGSGVAKDETKAIAQFHFAARWGLTTSIDALRKLNAEVPPADLLAAAEAKKQQDSDAAVTLGLLILTGAIEGYNAGRFGSPASPATYPSSASGQPTKALVYSGCSSDYDCGTGKICAKAMYQSTGACLQAVNAYGTPTPSIPSPSSVGPRLGPSCQIGSDCPPAFRCDFNLKLCVK